MEIQITEAKPKVINLGNVKPYTNCELISTNEAIVYDKYRFDIVQLTSAINVPVSGIHRPRSKSPLPHMSGLQKIL